MMCIMKHTIVCINIFSSKAPFVIIKKGEIKKNIEIKANNYTHKHTDNQGKLITTPQTNIQHKYIAQKTR